MKKYLPAYYTLLAFVMVCQLIGTAITLSQNIGYGQKISFLEEKQASLIAHKTSLEQAMAKEVAMNVLDQKRADFQPIQDVIVVKNHLANLASR